MVNLKKCLFSHPDGPPDLLETLQLAMQRINRTNVVTIHDADSLSLVGRAILNAVQSAIEACDLFMCDLTGLRPEALFQLGYAIAKNKPVWICLNSGYPDAQGAYQRISPLAGIGCSTYENSYDLESRFLSERPFENLQSTVYQDVIESLVKMQSRPPALFYLQSTVRTDASLRLTRNLQHANLPIVTDDPLEVGSQPLSWYSQNTYYAYALLAHLIDRNRELDSNTVQNAKYALVAGMAHGFGKPVLILTDAPVGALSDYQPLVKTHRTAAEAMVIVEAWLATVKESHNQQTQRYREQKGRLENVVGLQRINLGEYIAENETGNLADYFVRTAPYKEALRTSQYKIFVGRKGSGKTANLQQLETEIRQDKRNYVCVIRPVDYEFEGVLHLLTSSLSRADSGYLIQSLWKYLIYTELALSIYTSLQSRPQYVGYDEAETQLMDLLARYPDLQHDLTVRMEYAIEELCKVDFSQTTKSGRARVSEILHDSVLVRLHEQIGNLVGDRNRVYILIDNLDKAWRRREDLDTLAEFLFGLLSAGQDISQQFQKGGWKRPSVNLALIIFLREDIYSYISASAREVDKLASARIDWNDPTLLHRVIEERFSASLGDRSEDDIWDVFFVAFVRGTATKDYIVQRIIPRPRDIIFLCRSALSWAVNRQHTQIEEQDILDAEREYSEYALNSLVAEIDTQLEGTEELLYEFVGQRDIVTQNQVDQAMKKVGIPEVKLPAAIDLLCESTFLGLETAPNCFTFLYESGRKRVYKKLAENVTRSTGRARYRINYPFHSFLEVASSEDVDIVSVGSEHLNIEHEIESTDTQVAAGEPANVHHSESEMISVLFLSADPTDASRLRVGQELREVQEKLRMSNLRERFTLHQRMSVRSVDISQALLDLQPQIVHFSGHGTSSGALCVENQAGESQLILPHALAALFGQFTKHVECVILNACYSEEQATAIAEHIDYVIGMNQAIGDSAAIAFATGFYQALGAGRTIEDSYKLGCAQIELQDIPEHLAPVLIKKDIEPFQEGHKPL